MNTKWKIVLGVAIAGLIVAIYAWSEFSRTHKSVLKIKPFAELAASELLGEFEMDEMASAAKYNDKVLSVKGVLTAIQNTGGQVSITISDEQQSGSVICEMDMATYDLNRPLEEGMDITVRGVCAGFMRDDLLGSDVILVRCVVE